MIIYSFILFFLGVLALTFHLFDIFAWFMPFWAIILMIVSLGMLVRISQKEREGEKEKLCEKIQDLEAQISKLEGKK